MWEYKVVEAQYTDNLETVINGLAALGWELVAVEGILGWVFFFKRMKP
jgi:Domain of unknown function (DUF4177)